MSRKKHHGEHHEEHMDESWLVPYADILTLLLALFIVLFASAQVDQKKFEQIRDMLSDGVLHRLGILGPTRALSGLTAAPGTASSVPARLMMLAAADSWARAWASC